MKDYLKQYGAEKRVPKFNTGGMMPGAPMGAPAGPPAEAPVDPIMMAQQAVESQDGALALEVCAMLLQEAGGGAAPMDPSMGMDPAMMGGGMPMAKNGMKIPSFKRKGAKAEESCGCSKGK